MMDDEKMDELIRRAAADYNRPPATPRDAMWEAIRAARAATPPAATPFGAAPARQHEAPRVFAFPVRHRSLMAAAAVALLAVGIGIGRLWPTVDARNAAPAADSSRLSALGGKPRMNAEQRGAGEDSVSVPPRSSAVAPALAEGTRRSSETRGLAMGSQPRAPSLRSGQALAESPRAGSSIYQAATLQHLVRAEALLTSYRAEARAGKVDAELSAWARDLLSSTRLLLDSPAARDPRRRQMLEDLELVLVQIVHLAPDSPEAERDFIDRAIERGDVMTRLRTTSPAGAAVSGS